MVTGCVGFEGGSWSAKLQISKHTGPVAHVDFSADGQMLRSSSSGGEGGQPELRVFNVETGDQVSEGGP